MRNVSGPECLTTMQPCNECMFVPGDVRTELGEAAVAEQCGVLATRLALRASQERTEKMMTDSVTGFLTDKGMELLIETDESLQRTLTSEDWGLAWIDVRGLKFVNDKASEEAGNVLLNLTAEQISHTLNAKTRTQKIGPQPKDEQRKQPETTDIKSRYTGDEFLVLFRGVSPDELENVAGDRLTPLFSVEHAIRSQETPVIASLSFAHSSEVVENGATPKEAFDAVLKLAQKRHHGEDGKSGFKKAQYDEMWDRLQALDADVRAQFEIPEERGDDDRAIVDKFYKVFRPDYLDRLSDEI